MVHDVVVGTSSECNQGHCGAGRTLGPCHVIALTIADCSNKLMTLPLSSAEVDGTPRDAFGTSFSYWQLGLVLLVGTMTSEDRGLITVRTPKLRYMCAYGLTTRIGHGCKWDHWI